MSAVDTIKEKIQQPIDELKNFDWNDLQDIETIGIWPGPVKL